MSTPKFSETHNLVVFLEKPKESNALTFLETAKANTVNRERQIQALVDKKKVIITEKSVRSDLMLEDAEGIECLPNDVIFKELTLMGNEFSSTMASSIICLATNQNFNFFKYIYDHMMKNLEGGVKFLMYPRFVQVFLDKQVEGISKHKGIYVTPSHTKKVFANIKRPGKGFSDSAAATDSYPTPIITQLSSSKPQKKQSRRKQRKGIEIPSSSGEPIADEVDTEENRLQRLLKHRKFQGRKIADLDADAEVTLIDETQGRNDEDLMFDIGFLDGDEVFEEPMVNATATTTSSIPVSTADPVTTAGEVVTTASVDVTTASAPTTIIDELTLAHTLIEIKTAKPKAVTTAATTITLASTRPKAKGIVFHDQEEQAPTSTPIVSPSQPSQVKYKGKAKMVEPEKPLKKKDQIAFD
ncbi:hypothetical protein Tco_1324832 [Tanacetum coccineum]